MSAISSISSSASAVAWTRQKPDASTMATTMMKKADADGTGTISQAELEQSLQDTSGNKASRGAATLMKTLDSDSSGSISKQELTDGLQKLSDQLDAQFNASRTTQAGGAPLHGGHGRPPRVDGNGDAASTSTSSATSTSSTTSDPADVNQDGSVSAEERLAYQAKENDKNGDADAASEKNHGVSPLLERLAQMYSTGSTDAQSTGTVSVVA